MDSEKKTRTPIWLYVLLGLLAVALAFLAVRNSSLKNDKEMLEAERNCNALTFKLKWIV